MAGTIKGIIVEIGGDTTNLQRALKSVNSATASLSKELRGVNSLLKLDPSNTELLAQKQEILNENIQETSKKLKSLESVQDQVYGKWQNYIKLKPQIEQVATSIKDTEKQLESLKQEQEKAQKAFEKGEITEQQFNEINNKVKECQTSLSELRKEQKQLNETTVSTESYRDYQREIIKTKNEVKNLQVQASNWTQAGKKIEEFGNKVTNISSKIDNLGSTLTTSLTLPVLAIGTAAITTGNDFEAQMSRVQAIAGATKDELKQLTDQAIQLGAETTFSASEVAEGMENLASAGFNTNEIMEAMPGLLDLAASSGAELATSSEIAASAIRGFGLEADKTGHVADVFAEAAARTNAQTEDMGEAMKYVAPVAKTVGLSIEETAAAIGIMSDAGVKGSQAGTTLRGGLTRIVKPTKMVRDAMEELGVEFYDSNGKMKSLTEIIKTLQDHTKGLTDETKNQALAQIFGTEALSGMLALVNRGSDELADMTKSFENCDGAAEKMADTMLDNTKGAFESLSGSLESAGIAIQQTLAPHIKDLAKEIQDLVDDFNDLSDEQKDNVIKTALLVAAIGPAVKILGTLGKGVGTVTKGIGTLSQAIGVFKTGAESANTSANKLANGFKFMTSTAGITTTAITAVTIGIGLLKNQIEKEMESIKDASEELKTNVETRQASLDTISDELDANMSQIANTKQLREELSQLVDENGKVKEGYESRVQFILNELNGALGTEYKLNGDLIDSYNNLKDSIDEVIEKKQAQLILESQEKKAQEAINNKDKTMKDYLETQNKIAEVQQKINDLQNDWSWRGAVDTIMRVNEYKGQLEDLQTTLGQQDKQLQEYNNAISTYQQNSQLMIEGGAENYKKIEESVAQTQTNITNTANAGLAQRINNQIAANEKSKELYDLEAKYNKDAKDSIYATNVQKGQESLQALADELIAKTSTIGVLGQDEILAWKTLASNSYDVYKEAVSKMSPEMQNEIQKVTGVVAGDATMQEQISFKAGQMTEEFKQKLKLSGYTDEQIQEIASNLENNTTVPDNAGELANKAETKFEENDSKTWGSDMVEGIGEGIQEKGNSQWFKGILGGLSGLIASFLHFSRPDVGPLREYEKWMPDMVEGLSKTLDKSSYKLLDSARNLSNSLYKELDFGNFAKEINGQITAKTQTIFTTPQINFYVQEMDEDNLNRCFNYVNRKFGSKY